jgi:hypothetical protein
MLVNDFSRFILPEVVGCPDPLLDRTILQAAFHFCDHTGAWSEIQDPIILTPGRGEYEIDVPPEAVALRARDVFIDGTRIPPGQFAFSNGRHFDSAKELGLIFLRPAPMTAASMQIRAVFAPLLTAKRLPDFLLSRYEGAISSGVKARLMMMPGVSWSNPQLGQFYQTGYQNAVAEARAESVQDGASGSLYVPPRRFG